MKKLIAILISLVILFCGCDSYRAFLSVESGGLKSWSQSHDYLDGTKSHILYLESADNSMEIDVVTEEGEIDITVSRIGKGKFLEIEEAETGKYYFSTEGWVLVKIDADDHKGSITVKKTDS